MGKFVKLMPSELKPLREVDERLVSYNIEMTEVTGTFLNFKYTESFAEKNKQLKIEGIPSIFTIKEAV